MEYEQPTPRQRMKRWQSAAGTAIKSFNGAIPAEALESYDQALYLATRANAPGADPDHVYAAATPGFRESAETAQQSVDA